MSRYLAAWYAAEKLGPRWLPLDVPELGTEADEWMRSRPDRGPQEIYDEHILYPKEQHHAEQ